jgi:hypothetical protein
LVRRGRGRYRPQRADREFAPRRLERLGEGFGPDLLWRRRFRAAATGRR